MKVLPLFFLLTFSSLLGFGQQQTVNYTEIDSFISNPSRGFYAYTQSNSSSPNPIDSTWLANARATDSVSIIFRYVYFDTFLTSPISTSFLNTIEDDFAEIRKAGFKVILRFAYTSNLPANPPYNDSPSKVQLFDHIEQLRPILQNNADVILTLQNGFWGTWGENFFSDVFGSSFNGGVITAAQWADRKEVTDSLLSIMPPSTLISLRYPELKATFYNLSMPQDTITLATAYDQSVKSRLGFHNDCFLVSANDFTFGNTAIEKPYWEAESKYTIMGGESCGDDSTYTNCPNALTDLENAHWTYANNYYHPDVIARWRQEGCYEEIENRLGYRFVLDSGNFDTTVVVGGTYAFDLGLENVGFASTAEEKAVNLVFKNADTTLVYNLNQDSRYWYADERVEILENINISAATPVGEYDLYLQVNDINPVLQTNPLYAIRMANEGIWDAVNGLNDLKVKVEIQENTVGFEEALGEEAVRVYPNPSSDGVFNIAGLEQGIAEGHTVVVYDLMGRELLHVTLPAGQEGKVSLSHLEDGTYMMKINQQTVKVLKY